LIALTWFSTNAWVKTEIARGRRMHSPEVLRFAKNDRVNEGLQDYDEERVIRMRELAESEVIRLSELPGWAELHWAPPKADAECEATSCRSTP